MFLLRLCGCFFLIALGLGYLFDPRTILRLNAFMRERIFHDTHVLFKHRRIGSALLVIGFFALFITLRGGR